MSWGAQSRSEDAKTPSASRGMSQKPEPDCCPIQPYTKPSTTPPARAWAERHHPGVVGEPAAGCIPSVRTPWVVGAGSGRVPGPKLAAGTAAGAAGGFLGHREGQKSVGFCPLGGAHQSAWSLYIMLGHTPRRQKVSGGCVTAISGSAPRV